jgi:hypothetical protein
VQIVVGNWFWLTDIDELLLASSSLLTSLGALLPLLLFVSWLPLRLLLDLTATLAPSIFWGSKKWNVLSNMNMKVYQND